jgi:hypothetical protein
MRYSSHLWVAVSSPMPLCRCLWGQVVPSVPTESGGMEINTQVRGTLTLEDVVRRETCHLYSERLWSRRQTLCEKGSFETSPHEEWRCADRMSPSLHLTL